MVQKEIQGKSHLRYALLSVQDKRGIVEFARGLTHLGLEIVATDGTKRALQEKGIPVNSVQDVTGFPEILAGRVKTLNPKILGGVLARRDDPRDLVEREKFGIPLIDVVACNLYDFEARSRDNGEERQLLEEMDIGGVTLVRAAVKNYIYVIVVTDPLDYPEVLKSLSQKEVPLEFKRKLALKAITKTAEYDALIQKTLYQRWFPHMLREAFSLSFRAPIKLHYGENPHQEAFFYGNKRGAQLVPIWGKALSYNNLLDMEAALELLFELGDEKPAAVIVKHTSPCGAARSDSIEEAFKAAWESDSKSAFGGIVALNRPPSPELAEAMNRVFLEVVLAPSFGGAALETLKKKRKRRLIPYSSYEELKELVGGEVKFRSLFDGVLLQSRDNLLLPSPLRDVEGVVLSEEEEKEALFGTKVVKHVKSNAIVITKDERTLGIGSGLPSRVDAVKVALSKAGERARGATLCSDAFFPFADSIELAARAGIAMIVQPGGSIRDNEVTERAKKRGIKMVMTGFRHFKH